MKKTVSYLQIIFLKIYLGNLNMNYWCTYIMQNDKVFL